jgi:hypothetical protein
MRLERRHSGFEEPCGPRDAQSVLRAVMRCARRCRELPAGPPRCVAPEPSAPPAGPFRREAIARREIAIRRRRCVSRTLPGHARSSSAMASASIVRGRKFRAQKSDRKTAPARDVREALRSAGMRIGTRSPIDRSSSSTRVLTDGCSPSRISPSAAASPATTRAGRRPRRGSARQPVRTDRTQSRARERALLVSEHHFRCRWACGAADLHEWA